MVSRGESENVVSSGVATRIDSNSANAIIEARNIVVQYGGQRAVDGVSLSFEPGVVTGIIGPNGAGKSSLVDVITGASRPTSGEVLLDKANVTAMPMFRRARKGLIRTCQDVQVFGHLSVLDNVLAGVLDQKGDRFWAAFGGPRFWRSQERNAEIEAMQLLRDFQIEAYSKIRCDSLSGGQRRIVEYLRVLMARPRVLVLDEPSVGLAPWVVERLAKDLKLLADQGCCVILIEHEMDLIRVLCKRVVGMAGGRVVSDGTFEEVINNEALQSAYLGRI